MAHEDSATHAQGPGSPPAPPPIVIQTPAGPKPRPWLMRVLLAVLLLSILLNISLVSKYQDYYGAEGGPRERFHSGSKTARDKIALIKIHGTIMPPFTGRIVKAIRRAAEDEDVRGVVLSIDSPGGLVADSHQIYHELTKLRQEKPIYVAMRRMAASGGYYVAMGAGPEGRLFAEPTTWTGSIGVIIPRYDLRRLAEHVGVSVDPLKTGPFKDSLSPFRELTPQEREVWEGILEDAFQRFLRVIAENRSRLNYDDAKKLATGQVFVASEAKDKYQLIDEIGYEEDAVEALAEKLGLTEEGYRVVTYRFQPSLVEFLMGNVRAHESAAPVRQWLESTVPQALYYCTWLAAPLPVESVGE
ncbi:MAG TPA: signal peptide peptidase SppA [Planctomycetaceae bacterium]|nr:signal peptide peptidase SppA [Planctomycetaceae bacterium]